MRGATRCLRITTLDCNGKARRFAALRRSGPPLGCRAKNRPGSSAMARKAAKRAATKKTAKPKPAQASRRRSTISSRASSVSDRTTHRATGARRVQCTVASRSTPRDDRIEGAHRSSFDTCASESVEADSLVFDRFRCPARACEAPCAKFFSHVLSSLIRVRATTKTFCVACVSRCQSALRRLSRICENALFHRAFCNCRA